MAAQHGSPHAGSIDQQPAASTSGRPGGRQKAVVRRHVNQVLWRCGPCLEGLDNGVGDS
jgi:hypothetical protein